MTAASSQPRASRFCQLDDRSYLQLPVGHAVPSLSLALAIWCLAIAALACVYAPPIWIVLPQNCRSQLQRIVHSHGCSGALSAGTRSIQSPTTVCISCPLQRGRPPRIPTRIAQLDAARHWPAPQALQRLSTTFQHGSHRMTPLGTGQPQALQRLSTAVNVLKEDGWRTLFAACASLVASPRKPHPRTPGSTPCRTCSLRTWHRCWRLDQSSDPSFRT